MSQELIQSALEHHNKLRALHGAPPLIHNPALSNRAQQWANHQAEKNFIQHSDCKLNGKRIGENCAMSLGSAYGNTFTEIGKNVTQSWYEEIKDYNFTNPGFKMNTGHFTQVVWKETKEFGIGYAKNNLGFEYITANYFPAGNYLGHFTFNVKPLK